MEFEVVIEVPAGSRNKYEFDHRSGKLWLDRRLFTAARYPVDYGYIEGTRGPDGDPLDVMVVLDEPALPGAHVMCRPVALLFIETEGGPEPKVLAVPTWDDRNGWRDLDDVPQHLRREIGQFFEVYKDLQRGSSIEVGDWAGRSRAEQEVGRAMKGGSKRR